MNNQTPHIDSAAQTGPLKALFVCSMNKWRSPTAEKIFANHDGVHVRSGGTSRNAVRTVSAKDLAWADVVFVMESKHRQQLQSRLPGETRFLEIRVLDIPDEYQFMDPELIQMLEDSVAPFLVDDSKKN